ncbi:hypothetical protein CEUSTIGMA_g3843.t1 [Chlamydomonas eustigma]|uniref:Histone deacetylase domain-containing protein n=1 Tax=Chlamydomonas eustigma TaxID=1157962 RepID=A0A250X002_9CHLO|nr:hypothetical protein CEUSTIGMA_g3843.t1 [Chlamydomonas eustigma]|eukprot:GAX76398.1 hypothetical protein CEUSTIGMA_g3843.t1 [Chlamydomonas eustigma]
MLSRWTGNVWGKLGSCGNAVQTLMMRSPIQGMMAASVRDYGNVGSTSLPSVAALPVVYHPSYSAPQLKEGHRFPMAVFGRIHHRLLNQHRLVEQDQVFQPAALPSEPDILLVHDPDYLHAFNTGTLDEARMRRIGFGETTRTPILVERTKAEIAGTLLTARLAIQHGLACNTAGGTHHAYRDQGSGFCILNDLAVTTEVLIQEGKVNKVLILDLDVHQGDGTASMIKGSIMVMPQGDGTASMIKGPCMVLPQGDGTASIFQGRSDVFTLSVHCESNFPARKQKSTLDIGLPDGMQDKEYLATVAEVLPSILTSFRPDLVLYDAGVDIHEADHLGKLQISDEGLLRRELLVLDTCLSFGIPIAGNIGGGYDSDLDVLADRHICLHRAALRMWREHGL